MSLGRARLLMVGCGVVWQAWVGSVWFDKVRSGRTGFGRQRKVGWGFLGRFRRGRLDMVRCDMARTG